ncbi:peptidoglycan-binding protein [Sulfurovum sp.]|uniref:peptidoglycan-binding protein n=2 Tax=Sulfurovum sp. TaxID=1969726 RepID=UPI0025D35FC7|nr:peptidoglycan-binding protein [Sulfurovum sp.]
MIKIKSVSVLVSALLLTSTVSYANFGDAVVGGLVGGAVGSVITNEVYNSNRHETRRTTHHRTHKSTKRKKQHHAVPRMTDEKRIQKALAGLGFYHGTIDGEVNSYETRSAIKEMNKAYEISQSAAMSNEEKDALIYLGTLFTFDRYLIAGGNDKKTKGKRIQTALKIEGYYHGKIDGAVGRGTRSSIAQYKSNNAMGYGDTLNFEEEYRLVNDAKHKNDKNIDDTIHSLKTMGSGRYQPEQQPSVLKLQVPGETPQSTPAPDNSQTPKGGWE